MHHVLGMSSVIFFEDFFQMATDYHKSIFSGHAFDVQAGELGVDR